MTFCGRPLSRALLGARRTCPFALHMSAFDPKRTSPFLFGGSTLYDALHLIFGGTCGGANSLVLSVAPPLPARSACTHRRQGVSFSSHWLFLWGGAGAAGAPFSLVC